MSAKKMRSAYAYCRVMDISSIAQGFTLTLSSRMPPYHAPATISLIDTPLILYWFDAFDLPLAISSGRFLISA
jgi:hypothetical protein